MLSQKPINNIKKRIANKEKKIREKIPESTHNIQSKFEVQIHKQIPSREQKKSKIFC